MLQIKSTKKGAELISVELNGEEKLHDGLTDWNRHAPVLFPIVGRLKNDETIIEGKIYKMSQHGFARNSEFEQIGENSYLLRYNDETLSKFPFKFELYISYEVNGSSVITKYKVKNVDSKEIYFGLGGHPAFKCDYKNSKLKFEQNETEAKIHQLEHGLLKLEAEDTSKFIKDNVIYLNENIFDNDAIIMRNLKSNKVVLNENGKDILEFDFSGFPYLAIWSKPKANFICIEPWYNTTDKVNSNGKFETKEKLIKIKSNESFESKYEVTFF